MISQQTIKELTQKYQTIEVNVAREYSQHLFLSHFYQKKKSANVLFKGGTALRILYHSPRFSEDLDFTAFDIRINDLEEIFLDTILDIEKTGIEVELKEGKVTSGGYLGIASFKFLEFEETIQIEVSLRGHAKTKPEVHLVNSDYIPPYNLLSLPQRELVQGKIKALLDRSKARDFFDLYFLLRTELSIKKSDLELHRALNQLEKTRIDFKRELRALLPRSHQMILREFKEVLRRELKKYE